MSNHRLHLDNLSDAVMPKITELYFEALTEQASGRSSVAAWEELRKAWARVLLLSELCGMASVVDHLRQQDSTITVDNADIDRRGVERYALNTVLLSKPFENAIDLFKKRVPRLAEVVAGLTPRVMQRSFWITDVESHTALHRIKSRLINSLKGQKIGEKAGGVSEFVDFARSKIGLELAHARLEIVYRTNMQSALNAGIKHQLSSPDTADHVALYRLNEIHDTRTRGNPAGKYPDAGPHYQMDGFIESPSNAVWKVIWPPNGYQCRASISPITWVTARKSGWTSAKRVLDQAAIDKHNGKRWSYIQSGEYPDPNFDKGHSHAA